MLTNFVYHKEIILIILFITTTFFINLHAQDYNEICVTLDSEMPDSSYQFSGSTDPAVLEATDPVVFNIYYWRIDNPEGTIHPQALTQEDALRSVQKFNIVFNPIGIYFKYLGMGSFSSPSDVIHQIFNYQTEECEEILDQYGSNIDPDGYETVSQCQLEDLRSYILTNNFRILNSLNIYVPRGTTDFGGAGYLDLTVLKPSNIDSPSAIHELGHNFGLSHTWTGWYSEVPDYIGCEWQSRDPAIPPFNADDSADDIIDTPAQPNYLFEYCEINGLPDGDCLGPNSYGFEFYDTFNCEYLGTQFGRTNCRGEEYQISSIEAKNYMAYNNQSCMQLFSIGQGIRMKEWIAINPALIGRTTDIASLYEPYEGEYYVAGPDPDPANKPLFQPGFNYRFVDCECDCPSPSPYNDVSFSYTQNAQLSILKDETDFYSITHPNHTAIDIDFVFELPDDYGQSVRRCYDNWNRSPHSGSVTRFNDWVFNANVTITPMDSLQINSPTLIEDLLPGLYKIEKNYMDGATTETVTIKPEN